MDVSITVAVILGSCTVASSIGGPILLARLTHRNLLVVKKQDWARQDEVADAVRKATEAAAQAAAVANRKQDAIHALVNSEMTARMEAEAAAMTRELAMMREVVELNRAAKREPSDEALAAITATQVRVDELRASLADRHAQTQIAEAAIREP